jgi:hypothetical protein
VRIRNLSPIEIPKGLWRSLARSLEVGALLPGTQREPAMYNGRTTLSVAIRPVRRRSDENDVTTGDHAYGVITLFPCPNCSVASLTHVYLHELVHAWLFQYHEELYMSWDSCGLAERFADAGFQLLGGSIRPRRRCGSYALDLELAKIRLSAFGPFAKTLIRSRNKKTWRPVG